MANTKLFLVQFIIEADVTEWPDFDELQATDYFRSALKLSHVDKTLGVQVYLLARRPEERGDLLIEQYKDRGFDVEIYQNANTVGTDVPTYFALVTNPKTKTPTSSVAGGDHNTVEEAKIAARTNVDKRISRQRRQSE